MVFSCSLNDSIKATNANLEGWLRVVEKSGVPGKYKVLHSKVGRSIKRCLGLLCSLSRIMLYGSHSSLRLLFICVTEEFISEHKNTCSTPGHVTPEWLVQALF